MTWVKLPQEYADRTEIMTVGRDAAWMHTAALVYCAKFLTDGHVPQHAIYGLAMGPDAPELADRLIAVGLWYRVDEGFYVPDYLAWNPSRQHKAELSASRANNGRTGGTRSGEVRREAKTKQNASLIANQIAEQNAQQTGSKRSKIEANSEASGEARIPYPVSRTSPDDPSDLDPVARAYSFARAEGQTMDDWWDVTFAAFQAGYPKGVPKELRERWPQLCPDHATCSAIMEGLGYWCACRQWNDSGNDYVTAPLKFLQKRMWEQHPAPWIGAGTGGNGAQPQGRAGGDAPAKVYGYGDNDDPYWAENHGSLADYVRRRQGGAAGRPAT